MSDLLNKLNDEELDFTVTITDTDGVKATYDFLDIVFFNELEYVVLDPRDGEGYVDIFRVIKTTNGEAGSLYKK